MSRQSVQGYRSLAGTLRRKIIDGELPPGSRLPGEVALGQTYGLNRHTVRAALSELEKEELIYKIQGKGTFVSVRKIPYTISPGTSFSGTLEKLGLQGRPTLISAKSSPAPEAVAEHLQCEKGSPVYELEILRRIEQFPVCLTTSWLPADRFPGLLDHLRPFRSLYGILKRVYGLEAPQRIWSRIEAALPDSRERDALQMAPQTPILITHSLAADSGRTPIELAHSRSRSDAYTLHVNFPS
jgi:GntR family phosphonate transport system transcriptional regulator